MNNPLHSAGILGIGVSLPENVLSNFDLEKMMDTSDEWIRTRTGIRQRRVTDKDTATSDLGTEAARKALAAAGLQAEELDAIIVATATPDMLFPATACVIQANIGAGKAFCFDLLAACSGFIYALSVGQSMITTGASKYVMVIGAETLTKVLNWNDRNTAVLFGDGAGAVILGPVEQGRGLLAFHLGADGQGGDLLKIPAGGSRLPASHETVDGHLHTIHMNGKEVFKFAVRNMVDSSLRALEKAGLTVADVDYFVPHQANERIISAAAERFGLPRDKVIINLDRYGNMSSASIPVALEEAVRTGKINPGDVVLMAAFGGGLTWGSAVMRW